MTDVMMTCGEARRLLWPDEGPRRTTEAVVRAQAHVAACPSCPRFLTDMQVMADRIRRAAPRAEAPAAVRERLFKAVARARVAVHPPARVGARHAPTRWLAVAAGLVALGLVVFGTQRWGGPDHDRAVAIFADDHRRATTGEGIITGDSLTVARWLAARLPIPINVPLFPGAVLKGGRLYLLGQEPGAVLEYDMDGRTLSYFIVPARVPDPSPRGMHGMPALRSAARAGYRVVAWHDAGLTHALVADLPEPALTELARYCIHQMLAWVECARCGDDAALRARSA